MLLYVIAGGVVLVCSALLSMAGLGAAFIFVPLFFWLGIPLREAMPTALLLNTISLAFASASYIRGRLVDFRAAVPILVTSVLLSPLGAYSSKLVNRDVLLWLFAAFLVFAGSMMLFYRPRRALAVPKALAQNAARAASAGGETRPAPVHVMAENESITSADSAHVRRTTISAGVGVAAGYLGGLLGVGGGNFIVPVLNWLGFDPKRAAATTAFVVVFSSFAGFLGHASLGSFNLTLILVTGMAAIIGALLGSWLMQHKITSGQLKRIVGVVLYIMAVKIVNDLFK